MHDACLLCYAQKSFYQRRWGTGLTSLLAMLGAYLFLFRSPAPVE